MLSNKRLKYFLKKEFRYFLNWNKKEKKENSQHGLEIPLIDKKSNRKRKKNEIQTILPYNFTRVLLPIKINTFGIFASTHQYKAIQFGILRNAIGLLFDQKRARCTQM